MESHYMDVAPTPNKTIACQDLLKDGACIHSGWLRRQSLRNKLKIFIWPHVYVVISSGCVYCYSSEVAKKPATTFSLYGYDRVYRAGEVTAKEATWVFRLVHVNSEFRSYLFSASSQKEMLFWMKLFKQEMMRANGKLPRPQGDGKCQDDKNTYSGSIASQDFNEIESKIYEDSQDYIAPKCYDNKKENDDSDEDMENIVSRVMRDPRDRPPLPPPLPKRTSKMNKTSKSNNPTASASYATPSPNGPSLTSHLVQELQNQFGKYNVSTPTSVNDESKNVQSAEKPQTWMPSLTRGSPDGSSIKKGGVAKEEQYFQEVPDDTEDDADSEKEDFWSTIYFTGTKDKASEIMAHLHEDGVYLVRVNQDDSMVLHVYGDGQTRKYRIFKENDKYTLQRTSKNSFNSVEELVYFYYTNFLPNIPVCLTECYAKHRDFPYYLSLL